MATKPQIADVAESANSARPKQRRRLRTFAIIYFCFLLTITITAITVGYWTREHVTGTLREEITRNLVQKAQMLANRVNADHTHSIDVIASQEGQAAGTRATIVDSNGKVVADSEILAASLLDEGRRPEFVTALHGSNGIETRTRNNVPVLYVAVPVSGGAVRLAYPLSDVEIASEKLNDQILIACGVAAFAALFLAAAIARIVRTFSS
jgi:two-component system, OmpR family, phosphate regulon sensor histidine kinase PhoR